MQKTNIKKKSLKKTMTTQELEEIKEALKRVTQQQYDFQQMVDAKTASLADMGPNKPGNLDLEQK